MANIDTGEIRRWDQISDEEKKSGKWIPLPATDENGEPVHARKEAEADRDVIAAEIGRRKITLQASPDAEASR